MSLPSVDIPHVPPLLTPEQMAEKQAAEVAVKHEAGQNPNDLSSQIESEVETPTADGRVEISEPIESSDDGPDPDLPEVPIELHGLDAEGLVEASDSIGELIAAMLLAAHNNADLALADQIESIGKSVAHMTIALESVRLMLADTDTTDTLGPVAVTAIDYLTAEVLAWLTGSRPATGTEHPLPAN